MKKNVLFVLVLTCITASSQTGKYFFGFNSGVTFSNIKTDNYFPGSYKSVSGFTAGINAGIKIDKHLFVESIFDFYQSGFCLSYKSYFRSTSFAASKSYFGFENIRTQNYINNSWLLDYNIGSRFEMSIKAGFYNAFMLFSKSRIDDYQNVDSSEVSLLGLGSSEIGYKENKQVVTVDNSIYNRYDLGFIIGLGLHYNFNPIYGINLDCNYNRGVLNTNNIEILSTAKNYNKSINIRLGLRVNI